MTLRTRQFLPRRSLQLLVMTAALMPVATAASADAPNCSDNIVTFQTENDFFSPLSNTDEHYTNGLRLSLVVPLEDDCIGLGGPVQGLAAWLKPSRTIMATERIGYSFGQSIFTPDDTEATQVVENDRPYAGWLYVGLAYQATYERWNGSAVQDTVQLDVGVVGPAALGEEVQRTYHDLLGFKDVRGWHNQLHNEPGVSLSLERKWRSAEAETLSGTGLSVDMIPFLHATVGNVLTYGGGGAMFRLGQGLGSDFGPPRIRPGLPGSEAFRPDGAFAWYLFAGAELQAVAHNIFLDGNTFRDSHSVDREVFVGDFQAGLALIYDDWRVTYTHIVRTPEFEEQDDMDQFGAVTISLRF